MCGRFSQYAPVSDLVTLFSVDETLLDPSQERPRFNLAPTQPARVIAASADGSTRKLGTMRWGLVPRWAKDPSIGTRMINARTDKVATSNAYRAAFAKRRCIVPADGFFEWHKPDDDSAGPKQAKVPFHIHAADHVTLALAGLWETWTDAEGQSLRSFTILTCDANAAMRAVHHRMPVILGEADWDRWLAPTSLTEADQDRLLLPAPEDLLVFDEVSTEVNRASNDNPTVIEPVAAIS